MNDRERMVDLLDRMKTTVVYEKMIDGDNSSIDDGRFEFYIARSDLKGSSRNSFFSFTFDKTEITQKGMGGLQLDLSSDIESFGNFDFSDWADKVEEYIEALSKVALVSLDAITIGGVKYKLVPEEKQ